MIILISDTNQYGGAIVFLYSIICGGYVDAGAKFDPELQKISTQIMFLRLCTVVCVRHILRLRRHRKLLCRESSKDAQLAGGTM